MTWEQSGYGIHPFHGVKAPHLDAGYQDNNTVIVMKVEGILQGAALEDLCQAIHKAGKEYMNPPDLDARKASAYSLNLESLILTNKKLQKSFLKQFCGVQVRQDPLLTANRWYCAVSPEIFEALKNDKI
jgi:hypothetical protein